MHKAYELIDHHHDTILEFVSYFETAAKGKEDPKEVQRLIVRTREFAQFHFVIEESLMQIVKYPQFAAHRAEHQRVLEQIASIEDRVLRQEPSGDWLPLLRHCLFDHFNESDRQFAHYAFEKRRDAVGGEGSGAAAEGIAMDALSWHDVLKTGQPSMDRDHRKLIDLFNLLADSLRSRMGGEFCGKVLDELTRTAVAHFEMEERMMAERDYPRIVEHAAEHAMLIGQLRDYRAELDADSSTAHAALVHFAEVWLDFHILFSDKKFAAFLDAAG